MKLLNKLPNSRRRAGQSTWLPIWRAPSTLREGCRQGRATALSPATSIAGFGTYKDGRPAIAAQGGSHARKTSICDRSCARAAPPTRPRRKRLYGAEEIFARLTRRRGDGKLDPVIGPHEKAAAPFKWLPAAHDQSVLIASRRRHDRPSSKAWRLRILNATCRKSLKYQNALFVARHGRADLLAPSMRRVRERLNRVLSEYLGRGLAHPVHRRECTPDRRRQGRWRPWTRPTCLKPALALRLIALQIGRPHARHTASHVDKDAALARRFHPILPSPSRTV